MRRRIVAELLELCAKLPADKRGRSWKNVGKSIYKEPSAASLEEKKSGKKKSKQYWDEHKKERKRQKILGGPKTSKQMTENERVAAMAGAGTGCMGPGEY